VATSALLAAAQPPIAARRPGKAKSRGEEDPLVPTTPTLTEVMVPETRLPEVVRPLTNVTETRLTEVVQPLTQVPKTPLTKVPPKTQTLTEVVRGSRSKPPSDVCIGAQISRKTGGACATPSLHISLSRPPPHLPQSPAAPPPPSPATYSTPR
jgi:hypothetical protein